MVTLKDLSNYLGVSKTQISRALNGHSDVSESTRRRVEAAVRELGYHPNVLAQKLRSGRSGIVGLVLSEGSDAEESNLLLDILRGLAIAFLQRDILVVLNVMPKDRSTVAAYERLSREGRLDGFVVLNPSVEVKGINFLQKTGVPLVVHGRHVDVPEYPYVDIDLRLAGRLMAEHLVALGHRDIAVIDGPRELYFARERVAGVRTALQAAGVDLPEDRVHHGFMAEKRGADLARTLMADSARRPTAIIAGNCVLAAGITAALREMGVSIPDDVSVVAHDDGLSRFPASAFSPALAGSCSTFADAFDLLAEFLEAAISGDADAASLQRVITPSFAEGGSTAPPRSQR